MARLNRTAPRSDEEAAKEFNWMAQGKGRLSPRSPPSPSQQLVSPSQESSKTRAKRRITYSASNQAAKRQKSAPETNGERSSIISQTARQSGLSRTKPRTEKKPPVRVSGEDLYNVPDDPIPKRTTLRRHMDTAGAKGRPSTRSRQVTVSREAAHSEISENAEADRHAQELRSWDEEQDDRDGDISSGQKHMTSSSKAAGKIPRINERSRKASSLETRDDDEHRSSALSNERSLYDPSNSPANIPAAEDAPSEGAEAPALDNGLNNDMSLFQPQADPEATGEFELFGASAAWASICKAAQRVGTSKRSGRETQDLPELITSEVSKLVRTFRKVRQLYKKISEISKSHEAQSIELEKQLADKMLQIPSIVGELKENGSDAWNSNAIQDIYAHAIRKAIPMLRQALCTRNGAYSRADDVEAIQEMIDLQTVVLQLCEKAQRWKAKPDTDRPIINPLRHFIYPRLRDDLLPAFKEELKNRERCLRLVDISQAPVGDDQEAQDALEEEQAKARTIAESNERLHKALDRNEEILRIRRGYARPLQDIQPKVSNYQSLSDVTFPSHQRHISTPRVLWTQDEDVAFLQHLLNPDFQDMTAEGRYLAMLSAKKLQEKSPECLKERAYYFKDRLLANRKYRPYVETLYETASKAAH